MAAVLEARAIITAEDRTKAAFESIKARIAGLSKQIDVMDRAMGSVGKVAKNVDAVSAPTARMSADMERLIGTTHSVSTAIGTVDRASAAMQATMARSSAAVAHLSADLLDAGGKLKAIDGFKSAQRSVAEASLAMRKGQQDARLLGAELDAADRPTQSMRAAFTAAQASAARLAEEFKVEAAAAASARVALEELNVPVARLRAEEEQLRSTVERTTSAIRQQAQAEHAAAEMNAADIRRHDALMSRFAREDRLRQRASGTEHGGADHHGFGRFVLQNAAMAVGAGEMVNVGREAWAQGAELQHERIGLQNAGRTPEEMAKIEAAGRKIIGDQPTASFIDVMKTVAETTQAFGSVDHAVNNADFMMRTMSILKAAGGEHIKGGVGDVGRALAKTFEERQINPDDFQRQAAMMIPAMVASGGTFNPEQLYAFAQQAKSSLPSLSDRFLSKIAPSLIGAQGGDRAGTALNAFENVISGKANDKKQAQEWMSLGLLDPSKVITKNGQATSWKSGAVKDTFLAMTDPLAWSEKYLIPALQKQGVDTNSREATKEILDTMFRNQNANMFASEITQAASRARLHKDEDLYGRTGSFDEIYARNLQDFGVAAGALKGALANLGAAATAPLMRNAAIGLTTLAGLLNGVAKFGLEHPTVAGAGGIAAAGGALAIARRLAYQIQNGFGLGSSAKALDAAAAHLMEVGVGGGGLGGTVNRAAGTAETAAEGAGSGALVGRVVGGGPGVAGAPIYEAPAIAVPEIATAAAAAIGILGAAAVTKLVKESFEAQQAGKGGQWAPPTVQTEDLDRKRLDDQKAEAADLEHQIAMNRARSKNADALDIINRPLEDQLATKHGEITLLETRLNDLYAYHGREAERGAALGALPRPEEAGPDLPPGWSPQFERPLSSEPFGPPMPSMRPAFPHTNTARTPIGDGLKVPHVDDGSLPRAITGPIPVVIANPQPVASWRQPAFPHTDTARAPIGDGLTVPHVDDVPLPHAITGPIPVVIANPPSVFHDGWTDGERPAIERRSELAADHYRHDPEAARGEAMMEHFGALGSSAIDTATQKAAELQEHLASLSGRIDLDLGPLDAAIARLQQLKAAISSVGGTSGSLGPSYPAAAPTGRMGGPR